MRQDGRGGMIRLALRRQRHRCFYCGCQLYVDGVQHTVDPVTQRGLLLRRATADHFIPTRLGGLNEPHNIVASCGPCNHDKGRRAPTLAEVALFVALLCAPGRHQRQVLAQIMPEHPLGQVSR